jgi:hypothetical protein
MNIALHHFNNNINNQAALQTQLLQECQQLANTEGQASADHCTQIVNANIAQIFQDLSNHVPPRQTCMDIHECMAFTTTMMPLKREKRQADDFDTCRICEIMLNVAMHHFHNGITDKDALREQLLLECQRLGQFEGQAAADHCINQIVNPHIDRIYDDLRNGVNPLNTCVDIQQCGGWWTDSTSTWSTTHHPMPKKQNQKRVKRQQGEQDPCRTCEIIMHIALHHFNDNITDQNALQRQLFEECQRLQQFEGPAAANYCRNFVRDHINDIYNDLVACQGTESEGQCAVQTCVTLAICMPDATSFQPTFSTAPPKRVKRQMTTSDWFPQDPCRVCEIIINIARRNFTAGVTTEAALQAQLINECNTVIMQHEGAGAAAQCVQIINQDIDWIFADLNAGLNPYQTCVNLTYCTMRHQVRVKRQDIDQCRLCNIVVNTARHHFHNNITDEQALLDQLNAECANFAQQDPAFGAACTQFVAANYDKIYQDLVNGMHSHQTCVDIGSCMMMTTMQPKKKPNAAVHRRVKRQMNHDPCRVCEALIAIARRHFHDSNQTMTEDALQTQLNIECDNFGQHGFTPAEVASCHTQVNANIDAIYMELVNNPNANPQQVCTDLGPCASMTTMRPKRQKRQTNPFECRTCEAIIAIAYRQFHHGHQSQDQLQHTLLRECDTLGWVEGPAASQHCTQIVNNNMDKIYADLQNSNSGDFGTSLKTCQDIGECPQKLWTSKLKNLRM